MQRAARSFPGRLSVARQSLGRGCLLTACATQILPTKGTIQGAKKKRTSEYDLKIHRYIPSTTRKSKLRKMKTTDEIVSSTQQINHMHLILLYFSFHLMCHSPFSLVVEG